MVEVTFLGTGPSIPPPGRGNTAFVVRSAHSTVLAECGPTVWDGAQNAGIELRLVPHLFVSHGHGDHMLGFPLIVLARMVASKTMRVPPLNVFCPACMVGTLQRISLDVFPEIEIGGALKAINWHALPEKETSIIELEPDLRLTAAPVNGPLWTPTLGMRLDFKEGLSVAYSADTGPGEEVPRLAQGCDLLVHEAYYSLALSPSAFSQHYHSTASSAGITASLAKNRMLALIHLGPLSFGHEDIVAEEAKKTFFGQVLVPSDGDVVRLTPADIEIIKKEKR